MRQWFFAMCAVVVIGGTALPANAHLAGFTESSLPPIAESLERSAAEQIPVSRSPTGPMDLVVSYPNHVSVVEGLGAEVTLTLSGYWPPDLVFISVMYATWGLGEHPDPTATEDVDYPETNGLVSFYGLGSKTITVPTFDDGEVEGDEFFYLKYFGNAIPAYEDHYTTITILDNDNLEPLPTLRIGDASVVEGDSGATIMDLAVTLDPASDGPVTVEYSTCGVGCDPEATANPGEDYEVVVEEVTFGAGETTRYVHVLVWGDTVEEPNEVFFVYLLTADGATIADGRGTGTIINDDLPGFARVSIEKGPDQSVPRGTPAQLSITVTNTGTMALTDVAVDDASHDTCDRHIGWLLAGESVAYQCLTEPITATMVDVATVSAHPDGFLDISVTDSDDATLTVTLTAVILGGPGVVSDEVVAEIGAMTGTPAIRVSGADRYATAAAISARQHPRGANVVFVAVGSDFPDALAGGAVAGRAGGPVLLVRTDSIPAATANELHRLDPQEIIVLGGPGVVSDAVFDELDGLAETRRLAGNNRYETAVAISQDFFPTGATTAYLAVGNNFPDALAGGVAAALNDGPILLTRTQSLPATTLGELQRLGVDEVVILGGEGVIADSVVDELWRNFRDLSVVRIGGYDRYSTAVEVCESQWDHDSIGMVYIAVGTDFPDALAGVPAAALDEAPILLVGETLPAATANELARLAP